MAFTTVMPCSVLVGYQAFQTSMLHPFSGWSGRYQSHSQELCYKWRPVSQSVSQTFLASSPFRDSWAGVCFKNDCCGFVCRGASSL